MSNQPSVSIYIVTYLNSKERGQILKRTCEAALAQRYPHFEVVVGDNGGDCSAQEALASINDPRLKVCKNRENGGFTGNINMCLEHCSNDVIKTICDDDLIHPDFLACTVPFVDDETLVVADVEKFLIGQEPESMATPVSATPGHETRSPGYNSEIWNLPYSSGCIPSATLFTRAMFEALGGYDKNTVTSDWDFFIEACLHRRIAHVMHTLCYVGIWSGSLTEEMMDQPFFFPIQGLYTKFRVYHGKALSHADHRDLRNQLFKELVFQGLRSLKRLHSKAYRKGYLEYYRCFFRLLRQDATVFGSRPCNP